MRLCMGLDGGGEKSITVVLASKMILAFRVLFYGDTRRLGRTDNTFASSILMKTKRQHGV